jgi:hypothetical protein
MPSATKDTDLLTTGHSGRAPIRHFTLISTKIKSEIPDKQLNRTNKNKNTYCQTSQLEKPEKFQLHQNHGKSLFWTVLLLFEQFKTLYW